MTLEAGYTRFLGTHDPVTNNGQPALSVTLADRDGILLKYVPPPPPPPPPGPPSDTVAYWKMDEGTGTVAADSSGNGWTGMLTGGATWTPGLPGQAVHLDGTGKIVAGDIQSSSTIFWMRTPVVTECCYDWPSNTWTRQWGLVDKYVGQQKEWRIFQSFDDITLTVADQVGNYQDRTVIGMNLAPNTWTHVAIVYNNGVFSAYKNGVAVSTSGNFTVATIGNRTAAVNVGFRQVGAGGGTGGYLTGDMDEVRIYNRALSAAEIQAIYIYGQ